MTKMITLSEKEYREAEELLIHVINAADSIVLIGDGMQSRHGQDCEEAQALFYIGDSLRKQLTQIQDLLGEGIQIARKLQNTQ